MVQRQFWLSQIETAWQRRSVVWLSGVRRGTTPVAIECKWSAENEIPASLLAFRKQYPQGLNFIVAADIDQAFSRTLGELTVRFVNLNTLISEINRKTR